ncbi:MAG TPA: hypothetical protein VGP47_07610, partial [Parachlamydiaceae bacterium]|nr:hypothetical protein [Parachlamydiaceae bacterium]
MNTNPSQFERNHQKYPADSVYAAKPSHKYLGSITNSEVDAGQSKTPKSIRVIDDAIVVESVDKKTRSAAINHFTTSKLQASLEEEMHRADFYKGVAVSVVGIGLGIACPFMPAALTVVGGVVGAVLSIFGIRQAVNNHSAINAIDLEIDNIERMTDEWKDPVENIIAQRKQAGIQGFQYVYKNNLKGKVVHNQEVQELWLNAFSRLISGQQNLRQICDDNLLGEGCTAFSWNGPRLPDIEIAGRHFSASALNTLSQQFGACRTSFNNYETAINNEIESLNRQKSQLKRELQETRSRWLYPSECLYAQSRQEAAYLYENALKPYLLEKNLAIEKAKQSFQYTANQDHPSEMAAHRITLERLCGEEIQHISREYDRHPAVLNIQRAYERDRRMCELLYNQSQLVVNAFFDNRSRQLENACNDAKVQIEEQRAAGHHSLKETMDKILGNAENPLSYVNTSMPAVHRNWRIPQVGHEPSWNEVYGQMPSFQSNFRDDISEFSWNLFWSGQGLGRFSASPTSSWSSFSQDRDAFPFKQQWFNLHNLQQNPRENFQSPRTGMFMRELRVPIPPACAFVPNSNPVRTPVRVPADNQPVRPAHPTTFPSQPKTHQPERVIPGTRTATGFAGSERREPTPEAQRFAETERREPTRV